MHYYSSYQLYSVRKKTFFFLFLAKPQQHHRNDIKNHVEKGRDRTRDKTRTTSNSAILFQKAHKDTDLVQSQQSWINSAGHMVRFRLQ